MQGLLLVIQYIFVRNARDRTNYCDSCLANNVRVVCGRGVVFLYAFDGSRALSGWRVFLGLLGVRFKGAVIYKRDVGLYDFKHMYWLVVYRPQECEQKGRTISVYDKLVS